MMSPNFKKSLKDFGLGPNLSISILFLAHSYSLVQLILKIFKSSSKKNSFSFTTSITIPNL